MLLLNESFLHINEELKQACVAYVIRDEKRWRRYPLHMGKDIKRIQFLLKRSQADFYRIMEVYTINAGISGWTPWNSQDTKEFATADWAECVALMEYWSLWSYINEILKLK